MKSKIIQKQSEIIYPCLMTYPNSSNVFFMYKAERGICIYSTILKYVGSSATDWDSEFPKFIQFTGTIELSND